MVSVLSDLDKSRIDEIYREFGRRSVTGGGFAIEFAAIFRYE